MWKGKDVGSAAIVRFLTGKYLSLTVVYYLGVIMTILIANTLSPYPPMDVLIAVKVLSIPWIVFTLGYWGK